MTEITKLYRVQVYEPGSISTVEFTWDTQLGAVPVVGSQEPRPLEGRTESKPWNLKVVDVDEAVTNQIADSGRANLIGRLVAIQVNIDSGGWTTLAKGRMSGLSEPSQPGVFDVQVSDERLAERNNTIFTTTSTNQLYPPGLKAQWVNVDPASASDWTVDTVVGDDVLLKVRGNAPTSPAHLALTREDLKEGSKPGASSGGVGNFNFLRANIDGTDREVVSLSDSIDRGDLVPALDEPTGTLQQIWVSIPSSGLSQFDVVKGYLHMDGREPSELFPLHIGGDKDTGIDAMQLVKDIYDLNYGGDEAPPYDSAQFTALIGSAFVPRMWFRITRPWNMAEFVESIYRALLLVPFVNAEGEVDPQFMRLQQDVDPSSLTTLGPSEAVTAPTWIHSRSDLVTAIRFTHQRARFITRDTLRTLESDDWAVDRIIMDDHETEFTHDNIGDLGRHEITIPLPGLPKKDSAKLYGRQLAREIFDRFGDGPIEGDFDTLETFDEEKGTWVILTGLPIPNPETLNRGGSRVVQIMDREVRAVGFRYRYLDGGPNLGVLLPPTVAIGANADRPKHAVDVTITDLPAGTFYEGQIKIGSRPWENFFEGSANETIVIQSLPSNTLIHARARTADANRIRSVWFED